MQVETMIAIKKEFKVTYQEISEKSGVPLSTVQKVFAGLTVPRVKTAEALSSVMGSFVKQGSPRWLGAESFSELMVNHGYGDIIESAITLKRGIQDGFVAEGGSKYTAGTSARKEVNGIKTYEAFEIMDKDAGEYTIDDYEKLPDDIRVELIKGNFYDMASPSRRHQTIIFEMGVQIRTAIKKNKGGCKVYLAPSDVQLFDDDKTVVQPDLFILCKKEMIREERITHGAPEFVVEVLSKSNQFKDMTLKLGLYMDAGVKEYWIVNPFNGYIIKYVFYEETAIFTFDDKVPLSIYDGKISVDFSEIKQELIEEFGENYLEK